MQLASRPIRFELAHLKQLQLPTIVHCRRRSYGNATVADNQISIQPICRRSPRCDIRGSAI